MSGDTGDRQGGIGAQHLPPFATEEPPEHNINDDFKEGTKGRPQPDFGQVRALSKLFCSGAALLPPSTSASLGAELQQDGALEICSSRGSPRAALWSFLHRENPVCAGTEGEALTCKSSVSLVTANMGSLAPVCLLTAPISSSELDHHVIHGDNADSTGDTEKQKEVAVRSRQWL